MDAQRHEQWTRQMDADAEAAKLDFLFDEADAERQAGQLRDWPRMPNDLTLPWTFRPLEKQAAETEATT